MLNIRNTFLAIVIFAAATSPALSQLSNETADAYIRLAEEHRKNYIPDSAVFYYEKAADTIQPDENPEQFVNVCNQIGIILTRQDKYDTAKEYLNKALLVGISALDSNNLTVAVTYLSLGVVFNAEENYKDALRNHNKALAIRLSKLGENHSDVATSYGNIGNVQLNYGNIDKSVEAHTKAMQIREKLFGPDSPEIAESYKGLGNAYKAKKDYALSIEYHQKALQNKIKQRGPKHKDLIRYYKNLSEVYYLMGNNQEGDFYKLKAEEIQ